MIDNPILRPAEAAAYLNVKRGTLYSFVRKGKLPKPIKLGERARGWRLSTLDAYLADINSPQLEG